METIKKNDFIELKFTGRIKDTGEIFDTNIEEDAKKMNPEISFEKENENKSLIICVGQSMLLSGLDEALEEKELNKKYEIELSPEKAFGKRIPQLVRLMPINLFREKNANPQPGMVFALDNMLVRIISVSGGRVLADFNNPLSGKTIVYSFIAKRKITDEKEKINALMDFFFKKRFDFEIKEGKIILKEKNKEEKQETEVFAKFFNSKFKEILNLELV